MRDFKSFIIEARDAPLYHGTTTHQASSILRQNKLLGKTHHDISPVAGASVRHDEGWKDIKGVSTSRVLNYSKYYMEYERGQRTYVVFELNQRLLSQNNRIVPVNHTGTGSWRYQSSVKTRDSTSKYDIGVNEFEEFIVGDIKNFDKYVTKIIVPNHLTWLEINRIGEAPSILKHPKLFYEGKFVND